MASKGGLLSVFSRLPIPQATRESEAFSAQAIKQSSPHRIGKDGEGRPAILISTSDGEKSDVHYPVVLEHISVRYNVLCHVTDSSKTSEQGRFVVIRCESHDSELMDYFLRTMEVHIHSIGPTPFSNQVADMVEKLIELFRALGQPSKRSVQGLWAELLIIAESSDPNLLLRSWHAAPKDRYDFSSGRQCVEIKSASGQVRVHHFSLEQLNPSPGTTALVVSLFVERSADGLTVLELVGRIRARIQDMDLLAHLNRNVTLTLASDWRQAASLRFDHRLAKKSLRIFDVGSVPSISWPLPPDVTEVKFKANLSRTPSRDISSLTAEGGIFGAIAKLTTAFVSA